MRRFAALACLSALCCTPPDGERDAGTPTDDAGAPEEDAGPPAPVRLRIRFDTRFDTNDWVTPERLAVLEEAAAIWGRLLDDDFSAVPAGTTLLVRDPENPEAPAVEVTLDAPIDDLVVFVGSAPFDGRGGVTAKSFPSATLQTGDATLEAELTARWDGAPFRPWTGWISFDVAERWFADATPRDDDDIPGDGLDLLSTAVHELGHILGFGAPPAFTNHVDGAGDFAGPAAVALYGTPVPLTSDAAHFPDGTTYDGARPLMDVSDAEGFRYLPTPLDLAVLADVGYTLVP